jgi:SAM-dependent methyltransferase
MTTRIPMYGKSPFRNTHDAYLHDPSLKPHPYLLSQVVEKAGRRILDYGCATGLYMRALRENGFDCTGADTNERYLRYVRGSGFRALHVAELSKQADRSFDSTLLFEVLEHVEDPDEVLGSARRLTRKNIFVSVPNNEGAAALIAQGMTYAHCLDLDHRHFFTYDLLDEVLGKFFASYRIQRIDRIGSHPVFRYLYRLRILRSMYSSRLYAEVTL